MKHLNCIWKGILGSATGYADWTPFAEPRENPQLAIHPEGNKTIISLWNTFEPIVVLPDQRVTVWLRFVQERHVEMTLDRYGL